MRFSAKPLMIIMLLCWVAMLLVPCFLGAGEITFIANKDVPIGNLTTDEIKQIFLGDMINWKNNAVITVVLSGDEATHKAFLKQYIKRTPTQFQNVWRRNLFTGKGAISNRKTNADDLIQFVSVTKGAIGYLLTDVTIPENVKIVENK